ncbi:glycosyltransferase family 1 protein [Pannus brasiliensis CCIBt3594]|uniref:Glycosyltransferase family 1 protein n=1 Tax=Pannus brasiliensis CCIBt3594 TaxID=1427578 RepID=A0AAW9QSA8_9CHRO
MLTHHKRGKIALISVHGDPAAEIGKEEAGGQNVYVRNVGEALARQGWQVDMFTRQSDPEQEKIIEHAPGCRTIRLPAGPAEFIDRDRLYPYLPEFVESFLEFQNRTRTIYPLIHSNYWLSGWVGLQLRRRQLSKLVHTYHSLGAVKYKSVSAIPIVATTRLNVEKTCLETADRIVATSPQEKAHMRALVSPHGNIEIIPCGTDIHHFGSIDRARGREFLGLDPDIPVILYVGRFDPRKGIETLVRAVDRSSARRSGNFQLIIGGGSRPGQSDGKERERIESIVRELGLADNIRFPGRLDPATLPYYYAAADVCAVPSHYEPFGLVAIEAMACRTPVIASDVGGLQYTVVDGETGRLVPAKDEEKFAEAIDEIVLNPGRREEMGENARSRVVDRFSWDAVATRLDALYTSQIRKLYREFFFAREAGIAETLESAKIS